jgi:hypothetical protein
VVTAAAGPGRTVGPQQRIPGAWRSPEAARNWRGVRSCIPTKRKRARTSLTGYGSSSRKTSGSRESSLGPDRSVA